MSRNPQRELTVEQQQESCSTKPKFQYRVVSERTAKEGALTAFQSVAVTGTAEVVFHYVIECRRAILSINQQACT